MKASVIRALQIGAICLSALLVVATFVLLFAERSWLKTQARAPREAFLYGDTGTEIMPLPVLQVLPSLFPDQFQPGGPTAGDWVQQFGFIRGIPGVNEGLPVGFFVSTRRPQSGGPSPVRFVGVNCSLCHTSVIKRNDNDSGKLVLGMGTTSLDFIAWVDAFKTSVLDEKRLTAKSVSDAYERQFHKSLGPAEKGMIALWIRQTRKTVQGTLARYDAPYGGADLREASYMPNGPSRTQPFRNLVRNIMNRPALLDRGYCKIPSLFEQEHRDWGQFDGSVHNRLTRSVLAALAVGATMNNLVLPDISGTVTNSIDYTLKLKAPAFAEMFPDSAPDVRKVERGRLVYMAHCDSCHGHRETGTGNWARGRLQDEVIPADKLGTDPQRVNFRYYDILGDVLYNHFPAGHPLKPKREDIRPGPLGRTHGYINTTLESVYARAPYLHNGSVNTLAELINLKPRRTLFYRGDNLYDPKDVGLIAPEQPDAKRYFRFDTAQFGNSNRGHDYPWAYKGAGWNEQDLVDLLEYLKTI
jgi:hypothetical protein